MPTPTVLQLQLGRELKRMREAQGLTLAEAVEVIGNKETKLSRLENGQSSVRWLDVKVLCEAYGASPAETTWAIETAKLCRQRGRWSGQRATFAKHVRMAVDLEEDATAINEYRAESLPGLLQTEAYHRALLTSANRRDDPPPDLAVAAHLSRQRVLTKPNAPQVNVVVSESAIRRMVGDQATMRTQLHHLATLTDRPNIHLQILPFDAATHAPACIYPFTILHIPTADPTAPLAYVYLDDYDDGRYRDDQPSIETYGHLWQRFSEAALAPTRSTELLLRLATNT